MDRNRIIDDAIDAWFSAWSGYKCAMVFATRKDCEAAFADMLDRVEIEKALVDERRLSVEFPGGGGRVDFLSLGDAPERFQGNEWHCVNAVGAGFPFIASRIRLPL